MHLSGGKVAIEALSGGAGDIWCVAADFGDVGGVEEVTAADTEVLHAGLMAAVDEFEGGGVGAL